MKIAVKDFDKCCRLCLTMIGRMIPILGSYLDKMLMDVTSIKVSIDDGYPQQACDRCVRKLSTAHNFRTVALVSHKILTQEVLKNEPMEVKFEKNDMNVHTLNEEVEFFIPNLDSIDSIDTIDRDPDESLRVSNNLQIKRENENVSKMYEENEISEVTMIIEPLKESVDVGESASIQCNSDLNTDMGKDGENSLKCALCDYKCDDESILKEHNSTHNVEWQHCATSPIIEKCNISSEQLTETRVKCEQCSKTFTSIAKYSVHTKHHRVEKSNVEHKLCSYCGKRFKWKSSLLKHMKYHTGHLLYSCEICDKSYSSRSARNVHLSSHSKTKPNKCDICESRFTQRVALRAHIRKMHSSMNERSRLRCDHCDKTFFVKDYLIKHLSKKHPKNLHYKCNVCNETFVDGKTLKSHSTVHIIQQDIANDHDYETKMVKTVSVECICFKCGMKYPSSEELKNHVQLCKDERSELDEYLQVQVESKHYCKICSLVFTNTNQLLEHYNTKHTNLLAVIDENTGKKTITVFAEQLLTKDTATLSSEPKRKYFIKAELCSNK